MSESNELLAELDGKVTELLSKFNRLNEKSNEQAREIGVLTAQLQEKNAALELVKSENEALKLSAPKEDQEALKFKIGEMVKEIDRCISLLKV